MIDAAEASGQLKTGGTIVEPTSGNTGVGLALVAQRRGYRCIFVCPDKVSEDKQNVLRAYGAEVVVCPTAVPPDHPDSYYSVPTDSSKKSKAPGSRTSTPTRTGRQPPRNHRTGDWADTEGKITHFVAGVAPRDHQRCRPVPEGHLKRQGPGDRGRPRKVRFTLAARDGPTW